MPELPSASELTTLSGLLTPGIIILWIRGRFRDPAPPKLAEKAFSYTIVSVSYHAAAYPLFHAGGGVALPYWIWAALLHLVLPLAVGFTLAFFDRSDAFYAITDKLGLRPAHHSPTAWDYTFRDRPAAYAIVHLTDGSQVTGAWVDGSFASSTSGDRDLWLAQLWTMNSEGAWTIVDPPRSMLICGGAIRMVEFIEGGSDEQQ